jgi:hypothetical protein
MNSSTVIALEPLGLTPQQLYHHQDSQGALTPVLVDTSIQAVGGSGANGVYYALWEDTPHTLAYAADASTIGQLDLTTGARTTLLTQHVAGLDVLAWSRGDQRLAFVLGHHDLECLLPPDDLYVLSL